MTQEQKELLLKDLCARLPYRVVVSFKNSNTKEAFNQILDHTLVHMAEYIPYVGGIEIKPYLRPMSSMTEEEYKEFKACHCVYDLHPDFQPMMCTIMNERNMFDWLDKNNFDYRGLIPMDLAIEVTKKNNPYKD